MLFSVRFGMSNLSNQIKSNQIKSNQIKSYFPISHIPYDSEYSNYKTFSLFQWVKEDLNNHYHNTIHISFQFNLLFMINVLSKLLWPWMIVLRLSRLSPARAPLPLNEMVCSLGRSRMRNGMKMKMNNHNILSNTATWQNSNEPPPKVTISNDGRSKTSFSFSFFIQVIFLSFILFTHLLTKNQNRKNN